MYQVARKHHCLFKLSSRSFPSMTLLHQTYQNIRVLILLCYNQAFIDFLAASKMFGSKIPVMVYKRTYEVCSALQTAAKF